MYLSSMNFDWIFESFCQLCELCPVRNGVFKRTDNGRWVHLVCALYTPGVAFNEVDSLSGVTLTELPFREWGARECSSCDERLFGCTGVCISCDAGLCRTYFHVTWWVGLFAFFRFFKLPLLQPQLNISEVIVWVLYALWQKSWVNWNSNGLCVDDKDDFVS